MRILSKVVLTFLIIIVAFFLIGMLQMAYFFGRILVVLGIFSLAISLIRLVWVSNVQPNSTVDNNIPKYNGGHNAPVSSNTSANVPTFSLHNEISKKQINKPISNSGGEYKSGDLYK